MNTSLGDKSFGYGETPVQMDSFTTIMWYYETCTNHRQAFALPTENNMFVWTAKTDWPTVSGMTE